MSWVSRQALSRRLLKCVSFSPQRSRKNSLRAELTFGYRRILQVYLHVIKIQLWWLHSLWHWVCLVGSFLNDALNKLLPGSLLWSVCQEPQSTEIIMGHFTLHRWSVESLQSHPISRCLASWVFRAYKIVARHDLAEIAGQNVLAWTGRTFLMQIILTAIWLTLPADKIWLARRPHPDDARALECAQDVRGIDRAFITRVVCRWLGHITLPLCLESGTFSWRPNSCPWITAKVVRVNLKFAYGIVDSG